MHVQMHMYKHTYTHKHSHTDLLSRPLHHLLRNGTHLCIILKHFLQVLLHTYMQHSEISPTEI